MSKWKNQKPDPAPLLGILNNLNALKKEIEKERTRTIDKAKNVMNLLEEEYKQKMKEHG
tara:strand:- start:137 stop:313 length:177 start_codon:yes stop_codon:yes gene_type:complete